ncbi:trypsin-like serine protease [Kitasatospora sp. NPDC008050]|uniref:trypsin-like serine protease n=1 Tax=Kitasatospora sp. NPDC008050 TaxID=3364021 RepID=UPI0036E6BA5E
MPVNRPRTAWAIGVVAAALAADALSAATAGAVVGDRAADSAYGFTAKLDIGQGKRSCTGALIDPYWVATASSCFADNPAQGFPIAAGAPKERTTVTVGRTDLADNASGQVADVATLVPRADRDLVLAKLTHPVFGIAPAAIAATAPTPGEELRVAGFGRTQTEWVPDRLHTGTFTVGTVQGTTVDISGRAATGSAICKGDTGAAAFREKNGKAEIAALNSRSWQGGCLGESETRTGAVDTRLDDLASWADETVKEGGPLLAPGARLMPGQSVTGKDLRLTMQPDGNLVLHHRSTPDGALWASDTYGNTNAYAEMQPDGNLAIYKQNDTPSGGHALWHTNTYNNPGAYLQLQDDGNVVVYKKDGGAPGRGSLWATGTLRTDPTRPSGARLESGQWTQARSTVLIPKTDGDLVLYRKSDGKALWSSGTGGYRGAYLHMQTDGNAVIYPKGKGNGDGAIWASSTYDAGNYLKLQDDGNLVIYKKDCGEGNGCATWATGTFALTGETGETDRPELS